MRGITWVFSAFMACIGDTASMASDPKVSGRDEQAVESIVECIRAYESTLSCMQWYQSVFVPPMSGGLGASWSVMQEGHWFVDDAGVCGLSHRYHAVSDHGKRRQDFQATYLNVGETRFTADVDRKAGMLAPADGFLQSATGPRMILGDNLDLESNLCSRRLVAILEHAKAREYLRPTEGEPWPGVRAIQISEGYRADIEVRLDPAEGMAVRLIRMIDTGVGRPADTVVVL